MVFPTTRVDSFLHLAQAIVLMGTPPTLLTKGMQCHLINKSLFIVIQARVVVEYSSDVPCSHGKHPVWGNVFLTKQFRNLNCNAVITYCSFVTIFIKLCTNNVIDFLCLNMPSFICQSHELCDLSKLAEFLTLGHTFGRHNINKSKIHV